MDEKTRDKFMRDLGRKAAYKEMGVWLRERPILEVVETLHRAIEELEERWAKKTTPIKTERARPGPLARALRRRRTRW